MKTLLLLIFVSMNVYAKYDIRQIEPSKSVQDAILKRIPKRNLLLNRWSKVKLDKFPFYKNEDKGLSSLSGAIARIVLQKDIEEVNTYLLDERFQAGTPGTRISILGVCKREGDYDFPLQELIRIAYLGKDIISKDAYERVTKELLNQKGSKHYLTFRICMKKMKDTENHILMTETARYLTNQILFHETENEKYNNDSNGFNKWLPKHLKHLLQVGFDEINSKPYAGFTISTLLNLYDFAENGKVRFYAGALLDYLSMKYAMESIGNRRYPTFRRQIKHYNHQNLDHEDSLNGMMMYWVGNYDYLMNEDINLDYKVIPYGDRFAFNAAISTYNPSNVILSHIFEPQVSFQLYNHNMRGKQVVYKEANYIMSGGGVHRSIWPKFSLTNDVLAVPTILIPKNQGRKLDEMFHFVGTNKVRKRSNLCVGKRVMCGVNIHIPEIPEKCMEKVGHWSFYDFKKEECRDQIYSGLQIAVYSRDVKDKRFHSIGLIEVAEDAMDYSEFKTRILNYNAKGFNYKKTNTYTKSNLDIIEFKFHSKKKGRYPIKGGAFYGSDRVRGSHHKLNDNRMIIFSPTGELQEYIF